MALAVTSAPFQEVAMPALDLRRYIAAMIGAEGVAASTDLVVSQRAAGANFSVDIAAGSALVKGDAVTGQGYYLAFNDATFNLTGFTPADGTNPRIDRVVLRVQDHFHGDASNVESFDIITGTPTSGATLANLTGAAAVGNNRLLLANILVPSGSSSITTANIGDARPVITLSSGAPVGTLTQFAGGTAPTGWLLCDGSAVSRTTYASLFGVVGTTYGVGDGSTTFNIPDLRGRVPVGKGTHADVTSLGSNDGVAVANRRPKHQTSKTDPGHGHGTTDPTHLHTIPANGGAGGTPNLVQLGTGLAATINANGAATGVTVNSATTGITVGTNVGTDPVDAPAYLVLNSIIKT